MIAAVALIIWLYLCLGHGSFWRSGPQLPAAASQQLPAVDILVPARDEAASIGPVIRSLLSQDYRGEFRVILIDDNSSDGTAVLAGRAPNLRVIILESKPPGWSGKLWALSQGVAASTAPVLLFTDADVLHDPAHLSSLVAKLTASDVGLVSEMVRLNCRSLAERMLVPAFVYFFQMLYPFNRVNDPASRVAAAAGGTVLIRRDTLLRIGGIDSIRNALIDDVALAKAVKVFAPIFLGHSNLASSIRPYPRFADIWHMIARTAYTQLRYSPWLLLLTVGGLVLVWWVPAAAVLFGRGRIFACGLGAFGLSAASYLPTLQRYRRNPLWALALPAIAAFYMAATVGSAVNFWRGRGAEWKSRAYRSS